MGQTYFGTGPKYVCPFFFLAPDAADGSGFLCFELGIGRVAGDGGVQSRPDGARHEVAKQPAVIVAGEIGAHIIDEKRCARTKFAERAILQFDDPRARRVGRRGGLGGKRGSEFQFNAAGVGDGVRVAVQDICLARNDKAWVKKIRAARRSNIFLRAAAVRARALDAQRGGKA